MSSVQIAQRNQETQVAGHRFQVGCAEPVRHCRQALSGEPGIRHSFVPTHSGYRIIVLPGRITACLPGCRAWAAGGVDELRHGMFPRERVHVFDERNLPELAIPIAASIHKLLVFAVGHFIPVNLKVFHHRAPPKEARSRRSSRYVHDLRVCRTYAIELEIVSGHRRIAQRWGPVHRSLYGLVTGHCHLDTDGSRGDPEFIQRCPPQLLPGRLHFRVLFPGDFSARGFRSHRDELGNIQPQVRERRFVRSVAGRFQRQAISAQVISFLKQCAGLWNRFIPCPLPLRPAIDNPAGSARHREHRDDCGSDPPLPPGARLAVRFSCQELLQSPHGFVCATEPLFPVFHEQLGDEIGQRGGNSSIERAHGRRVVLQDSGDDFRVAACFEGAPAGEALIEHHAEAPQVAARIGDLATSLFGRHIAERTHDLSGNGHRLGLVLAGKCPEGPRQTSQAKVQHL